MLVSVYGTLREGLRNNSYLKDSEYLGMDILNGFLMFDLGSYPGVIKYGNEKIVVDVYNVDENTLDNLDFLESEGRLYSREIVDTSFGPSYIYTIIDPWGTVINGDYKEYLCYLASVSEQLN
jgi:gamma-glutamylcyclotransferase (GGCT)/AIG2-like uncharacterized protein YtfP